MSQKSGQFSNRPNPLVLLGVSILAVAAIIAIIIVSLPKSEDDQKEDAGYTTELKVALAEVHAKSSNFEDIISEGFRGQLTLEEIFEDTSYQTIIQQSVSPMQKLYTITKNKTSIDGHRELAEVLSSLNKAFSSRLETYKKFTDYYNNILRIWELEDGAKEQIEVLQNSSDENLHILATSLKDYYDTVMPIKEQFKTYSCDYDDIKSRSKLQMNEGETAQQYIARRQSGISSNCLAVARAYDLAKDKFNDDGTLVAKMLYASGEYIDFIKEETICSYVNIIENTLGVTYENTSE